MIWRKIDLYGQVVVWLISLVPVYFLPQAMNGTNWELTWLMHAAGLLVLGIWQATSCVANMVNSGADRDRLFGINLVVAGVMVALFLIAMNMPESYGLASSNRKNGKVFLLSYFILVDLLSIRYWVLLRKYYSNGKKEDAGTGRLGES